MSKSKLSAFVSVILVFLSGALVGAVANRLYMVNTVSSSARQGPPPRPEEVRRRIVAETRARVHLDDQQVQQLNQIYDEEHQEFDKLRQKWNADGRALRAANVQKIKAILRPDQIPEFEKLQAEREAAHRLRMQQNQKR